jgi:hypothetical protein
MSKMGRNEIRKVTAGYLNGIAVALLVSGAILPAVMRRDGAHAHDALVVAAMAVLSLALHYAARLMVRHLED